MIQEPKFEHKITQDAASIFSMEEKHEYTDDIECQYRGLLNFMDVLYYRNGNSSYPQVRTRHTIACLAMAMPSLAIIDPSRTKEISYNLHVCSNVINFPLLTFALDGYNSEVIRLVETGLCTALYRLVSGNPMNDELFHHTVQKLCDKMDFNRKSQGIYGIETLAGIYNILPNLMVLLIWEIHDRIFGTKYLKEKEEILQWINRELVDKETGLYRESYKTGAFGIENESLNPNAFFHTMDLTDNINAIVIGFMHYFDPIESEKAWEKFKYYYLDAILHIRTEEIVNGSGRSYLTQLSPVTEALYGALFTAKEMKDAEIFEKIQKHIFEITSPDLREGKMFLDAVEEEKLQCHALLLSRVHVGWKKIMEHNWAAAYNCDYNKIQ